MTSSLPTQLQNFLTSYTSVQNKLLHIRCLFQERVKRGKLVCPTPPPEIIVKTLRLNISEHDVFFIFLFK